MKHLVNIILLFCCHQAFGQYYYSDIIATNETNEQMKSWRAAGVAMVTASGTDNRGSKASGFSETYQVLQNGSLVKKTTINDFTKTVNNSRYNTDGFILSSADSLTPIQNAITYTYDNQGRIINIRNIVKDSSNDFNQAETHIWQYDESGSPTTMWRIIENEGAMAGTDSMEIKFIKDAAGNITEERSYKHGRETNFLYYYYNDANQMSDIVRYNTKLKKLIPEIMFEYDANGKVIQKITTISDRTIGYLLWRYIFDGKGLKTKEALFDNKKQLTGKINYEYQFNK